MISGITGYEELRAEVLVCAILRTKSWDPCCRDRLQSSSPFVDITRDKPDPQQSMVQTKRRNEE